MEALSASSSASTLVTRNVSPSLSTVIAKSTGPPGSAPLTSANPALESDDSSSSDESDDDLPRLPPISSRLTVRTLDSLQNPPPSTSAFVDPSQPSPPSDPRPLWKRQEDQRVRSMGRLQASMTDAETMNERSIKGLLVVGRRARPMDAKAMGKIRGTHSSEWGT